MNQITRWFEHPLYLWMDRNHFISHEKMLAQSCAEDRIRRLLDSFPRVSLEKVTFYKAGTYSEPGKTVLDNIPDFYEIRMRQQTAKNHIGTFRLYLPVEWNGRYMSIAGAGTNNEVDWFTSVTYNVISWPMALKNGYACAVADNDTGIHLDCSWGFDKEGRLEWDHIDAWAFEVLHEMTGCAKHLITALYDHPILASYMHGTSGGGRQVITEAALFPEDYDGLWADGPAINYLDLQFACLWPVVVESNERHIVPLSKYQTAYDLAMADPVLRIIPFDSRDSCWMDFIHNLLNRPTPDGNISRRDLDVMVRTWDGPFTRDGKRMAYGYGPTIRQWPLAAGHQLYGYFKRKPDGKLVVMPIAEQSLRWFTGNPSFDIYQCSYEEYERIYTDLRKRFIRYDFNECDFTDYAASGGKLIITHGTGDCVVPYQAAIDYYSRALDCFPSEKIMNQAVRMYMPEFAGHSILDWTGPAVSCANGMMALTFWAERGKAPDRLPTVQYDFENNQPYKTGEVASFHRWAYLKKVKDARKACKQAF